MSKKIVVLDYSLGNVRSVSNALRLIGASSSVTRDLAEIERCDGLIIPGVGAFPRAMQNLREMGLIDPIRDFMRSGRPLLGICLGMQILFDDGTEFEATKGLGLIPGRVDRIPVSPSEGRLPHIAWSLVRLQAQAGRQLFAGMDAEQLRFYFVHSFAATQVPPEYVTGTVDYLGHEIVAAVCRDNVYGTQFHPEKSAASGLQILGNFVSKC